MNILRGIDITHTKTLVEWIGLLKKERLRTQKEWNQRRNSGRLQTLDFFFFFQNKEADGISLGHIVYGIACVFFQYVLVYMTFCTYGNIFLYLNRSRTLHM